MNLSVLILVLECSAFFILTVIFTLAIKHYPARRRRCIFGRHPWIGIRWISGDLPISTTALTGGPFGLVVVWWVYQMGYISESFALSLLFSLWPLVLSMALFNSARKSDLRLSGVLFIAMVVSLSIIIAVRTGVTAFI